MNFTTINEMIENINKNMIKDEEISNFKNQFYNYIGVKNMEAELLKLDLYWTIYKKEKNKQNKELYNLLQNWFIL
jgi:hypothetical protein